MSHSEPPPSNTPSILGISNAVNDILSPVDEAFLAAHPQLVKGDTTLCQSEDEFDALMRDMGETYKIIGGGTASNTMSILSPLGIECAFTGHAGDDEMADFFTQSLESSGIKVHLHRAKTNTGCIFCFTTPDGERTMHTHLSHDTDFQPDHIPADWLASYDYILGCGYLFYYPQAPQIFARIFDVAEANNTRVVMGLGASESIVKPYREEILTFKNRLHILFANENEAMTLFGVNTFEDTIEPAREFADMVVLTHNVKGGVVVAGDQTWRYNVEAPETPVDNTGAGDAFAAGFLYGHLRGESVERCLAYAKATSAETVKHVGARPHVDWQKVIAAISV